MTKHCGLQIAKCGMENSNRPFNTSCSHFNPKSAIRNPKSAMQAGFTLIEIIVLIVMAGILLPAIIFPFATGVRGSGKPEMVTRATYLAHQRMEELMKFNYSRSPELDPILTALAPAPVSGYQWLWGIEWVVPDPTGNGFISSLTDQGYKMIFVQVRDPENSSYEIYSVVTNFP